MLNLTRSSRSGVVLALATAALVLSACREHEPAEPSAAPVPTVETASQALGEGFTAVDIGAVGVAGTYSQASGVHTVEASGADIWTNADEFRMVYETLTGDGTVTARVASIENTDGFAKAGVMMRENLTAGARNVMALVTTTAANGYRYQSRTAVNGTTAKITTGANSTAPNWLRITRTGNSFTAFGSTNGTTWTSLGAAITIAMPSTIYVGLALTGHNDTTLCTGVFDSVTITSPNTPPGAPTGLVATPGNGQVSLAWNAVSGATSYQAKRSTSAAGPFSNVGSPVTTPSFTNTGLVNGTTYYYVVSASNGSGTSANSAVASATPTPPTPPGAPSGLNATAGNGQVTLTWSAVSGATSYQVKQSTSASGPFNNAGSPVTGTSATITGLSNGTTYHFVVAALNAGGSSPDSTVISATPTAPPPPGAPTGLVATAGNAQVGLTWNAVSGATSYQVKSGSSAAGPFSNVGSPVTSPSFTHTGLTNNTTYFYVVTAANGSGTSGNSNVASATPTGPTFTSVDIGTVGVAGSTTESSGTFTVRGGGADMYGTADAFRFAYQTVTGDVTITARVASLTTQNVWTKASVLIREDLTAGSKNVATVVSPTTTNKYRQQVRSAAGGSTTSAASTGNSVIPSFIRVERVGNTFRSYSSSDGTSFSLIATATVTMNATVRVGLGVTSHVAGTLATAVFNSVSIVGPTPPSSPTALTVTPGNNQIYLTWTGNAAATSYTVKRSDVAGGPYTTVATGITVPQYINTGLVNGNTYYFVVSAQNAVGSSGNSAEIAGTPVLLRPSVRTVAPADGATDVSPTAFVSGDLIMPNVGGGVDAATLLDSTVYLRKTSDGSPVLAALNTSGGGDVIVLQPHAQLEPQTNYTFTITAGLQDLTGAPFVPYSSSFTTGEPAPPPPPNIAFDQFPQATAAGRTYTSTTLGPDNRLYAATITGDILRFPVNGDGSLGSPTTITSITSNNGGARAIVGLTFDPAATSSNLILWVTHGGSALKEAPDWTGKLTKLTGTNLTGYQDIVVNFPRSYKDHMTNSIAFKAGEPSVVYIVQGSMNAMGAPDNAWGQRAEHLLAAAILRLDTTKLGTLPLNVQTNDADPTASGYNPFAANAPLTIYATGIRNAYDLLWHSNGQLYTAVNGSAAGGNTPATPSPLPSACSRRIDGTPYTSPTVPAVTANPVAEDDFLFRIVQGGYYGHPNPSRCEWVLNGGNPTSAVTVNEVAAYPTGVQPDRNYRGASYIFGQHYSPNGMIEWKSTAVPGLVGKMLVIRYSGGDDIIVLTIDPTTKDISAAQTGITGMGGFTDPLDITHNVANGHIYVTEHAGQRIVLLRPRP